MAAGNYVSHKSLLGEADLHLANSMLVLWKHFDKGSGHVSGDKHSTDKERFLHKLLASLDPPYLDAYANSNMPSIKKLVNGEYNRKEEVLRAIANSSYSNEFEVFIKGYINNYETAATYLLHLCRQAGNLSAELMEALASLYDMDKLEFIHKVVSISATKAITYPRKTLRLRTLEDIEEHYASWQSASCNQTTEDSVTSTSTLTLFSNNTKEWIESYVNQNEIAISNNMLPNIKSSEANDVDLDEYIEKTSQSDKRVLLYGEGGSGKTYTLLSYCLEHASSIYLPIYVPLRKTNQDSKSPLLNYIFDQYLHNTACDRTPDSIKATIIDMLKPEIKKFVVLLDGINELAMLSDDAVYNSVLLDIDWLQSIQGVSVVVTSRTKGGQYFDYYLEVQKLDENRVAKYLRTHKNTEGIDTKSLKGTGILNLLQIPLFLSLFTETYSPTYTEQMSIDLGSIYRHSDMLGLCVEYHKNKFASTTSMNSQFSFALDVLLPLTTLSACVDGSSDITQLSISYDKTYLAGLIAQELRSMASDTYSDFWITSNSVISRSFSNIIEAYKVSSQIELFDRFVKKPVLENAVFLLDSGKTITWRHEILMEWFIARGIVFTLEFNPDRASSMIKRIADRVREGNTASLNQYDKAADALLPIALFIYELMQQTSLSSTVEYISLLSALSRAYSEMKDPEHAQRFATTALTLIDAGCLQNIPSWKRADTINHLAYDMQSASDIDMKGTLFDYSQCIDYAYKYYAQALGIIDSAEDIDKEEQDVVVARSQILGNIGANCIAQYKNTKDRKWLDKALRYHYEGLSTRTRTVLDRDNLTAEEYRLCAYSHNCLGTDYYYLGSFDSSYYIKSLEHHRIAVEYREKGAVAEVFVFQSYINCLGALRMLLLSKSRESSSYVKESIDLLDKALVRADNSRKSTKGLVSLRDACKSILDYEKANPEMIEQEDKGRLRKVAIAIDRMCEHESVISRLSSLI